MAKEFIKGLSELAKKYENLGRNLNKDIITPCVRDILKQTAKIARKNVPVRTGLLKRHIAWAMNKRDKNIVSGVVMVRIKRKMRLKSQNSKESSTYAYHAHLVEYGTSHSKAKPFLRPAINEAKPIEKLKDALDDGFKNLGLK